jgi:hypothetical protein
MSKCTTTTDRESLQKKVNNLRKKKADLLNKIRHSNDEGTFFDLKRNYDIVSNQLESEENILNKV